MNLYDRSLATLQKQDNWHSDKDYGGMWDRRPKVGRMATLHLGQFVIVLVCFVYSLLDCFDFVVNTNAVSYLSRLGSGWDRK